jgi:hypothetical protein
MALWSTFNESRYSWKQCQYVRLIARKFLVKDEEDINLGAPAMVTQAEFIKRLFAEIY